MSIHNEFSELLESASFSSLDDQDRQLECLGRIRNWMNDNTPSRLFRYRRVDETIFEKGFDINDVWGSSILNFNDSFESLPFADSNIVVKSLMETTDPKSRIWTWNALLDGGLDHVLKHFITEAELASLRAANWNTNFDDYNRQADDSIAQFFGGTDLLNLQSQFLQVLKFVGALRLVACFSETNVSSLMWGHYADSHKGYCLEYDFKRAFAEDDELCTRFSFSDVNSAFLAPVVYSDK